MKTLPIFSAIIMVIVVFSCQKDELDNVSHSQQAPELPKDVYDYDQVSSSSVNNEMATLGRVLFYDPLLSISNNVSCGSCHKQSVAFADPVKFSKGFEAKSTTRNAMAIFNTNESNSFFWDSRVNSLTEQALMPVRNHIEMGLEHTEDLETKLAQTSYYPELFQEAFGDPMITENHIAEALAEFMSALESSDSKYDNRRDEFTGLEEMGETIFETKAHCTNCHGGRNFSGWSRGENIGLDLNYEDKGIGEISGNKFDNGKFKVPSLRNVALTAPYMHDGRFATLEDVLDHYENGVKDHENLHWWIRQNKNGFDLTDTEKKALIAFLHTLTDENLTTNPFYSDPF